MSGADTDLSLKGRIGTGLALIVFGSVLALAAVEIGPLAHAEINGPRWLAAAAGAPFIIAGLLVTAGRERRRNPLSYVLVFVLLASLAAIGNWIAFGAGPRVCRAGFPDLGTEATIALSGLGCRTAFGVGALIMNALLFWMLTMAAGRMLSPHRGARALEKMGEGALFLSLSPILIPMVLVLVVKSAGMVLLDRLRARTPAGL